jgi:hypothetical protein
MNRNNRLCLNCNTLHAIENSNYCSQTCFDESMGSIIAKAIAESVLGQSQVHDELSTILIQTQLRRDL